jgi:PAS domain S-box-containing protein
MKAEKKTRAQLVRELEALRRHVAELQAGEAARTRAEGALRESERAVNILESMTDAFYALDRQWRFTYINRRAEQLLQRTREELLGKVAWQEFPEALAAITNEEFHRAMAEQVTVDFEVFHPPLQAWFEVHACPSPDGLSVYFRDVTARRQAEEALRHSEERFSKAFHANAVALGLSALADGRFLDVNDSFLRLVGYERDEVIGHTATELRLWVDPEERTRMVSVLRAGQPFRNMEIKFRRKGGEIRDALVSKELIELEGRPCVLSMLQDITERKRVEAQLRREKQLSDAILENMPAGVAFFDNNFVLRRCNPIYADLIRTYTPYTPEQALGMCYFDFVPGSRPQVEDWFTRVRDTGQAEPRENFELRIQDGERERVTYWYSGLAPVKDETGKVEGILLLTRDQTAARQAEEANRQLQAQLFQAQKLESLATLAGGVAHDFNNLLSVIIGFTELVTDEVPPDSLARRNLEEVLQASRRAKTLVQQLLAFSRTTTPERDWVALQPLIEETLRFLRASLPPTVQLHARLDPAVGAVWGSASQLQQVVLNLCLNAAQAMNGPGGELRVTLCPVEVDGSCRRALPVLKPGLYAQLNVQDTGHGIDPAVQGRIFEPFFTTKPVGEGSGLGLAVVHGIVSSHGGAVRVESQPGRGATFSVYLPVSDGRGAVREAGAEVSVASAGAEQGRSGMETE